MTNVTDTGDSKMAVSDHTPGPWAWVMTRRFDGRGKRKTLVAPNRKDPADGNPPQRLASLEMECGDPAEAKANADLIGAAPNLLDAAKEALAYLNARHLGGRALEVGQVLSDAIAKAEGS